MPDSTQINPSDYPDAELAATPATAWAPAAAAPEPAVGSAEASLQVLSCSPHLFLTLALMFADHKEA